MTMTSSIIHGNINQPMIPEYASSIINGNINQRMIPEYASSIINGNINQRMIPEYASIINGNINQPMIPEYAYRHYPFHPILEEWKSSDMKLSASNLMYPIILTDSEEINTTLYPGKMNRYTFIYDKFNIKPALDPLIAKGLKSILLIALHQHSTRKDDYGFGADSPDNPIIRLLPEIRQMYPSLLIACKVCMCPYLFDKHVTFAANGEVNREATNNRFAAIATRYAREGAQILLPCNTEYGTIKAIKKSLCRWNLSKKVAVMSHSLNIESIYNKSCKWEVPHTVNFEDRLLSGVTMDIVFKIVTRDIKQGTDMLIVTPGLPYLDVVAQLKERYPNHPVFVFQVAGEYDLLCHAANHGVFNLRHAVREVALSMKIAGADCIITCFTPLLLDILQSEKSIYNC